MVLEIASGSGEHAVYLAPRLRERSGSGSLVWQPSDLDPDARASIAAWIAEANLVECIAPPIALDARDSQWPVADGSIAMLVCINMIHIAPWASCEGLFARAARVLEPTGLVFLYGPFKRGGVHTAPSNEAFDRDLRARDPSWGVRDVDDVARLAGAHGFSMREIVEMPANNLSIVFVRV